MITTLWQKYGRFFQRSWRKACGEKGTAAVIAALGLTSFIGMAAIAIDVSHLYLAGSELQNAADASALAGATMLDGTAGGIKAAADAAMATFNKFEFGRKTVTVSRNQIRFAVNMSEFTTNGGRTETTAINGPTNVRFIKVTLPQHSINVIFAGVFLNSNQVALTRSAIAGLSVNGLGGDTGMNTICNWVPLCVVQDEDGAPLDVNAGCSDKTRFTPGCTYTIRSGSGGQGNGWVSPGNYQCLAPVGDNGGSDLRRNLAAGVNWCISPGSIVWSEPGQNSGPVRQGLNTRFGEYNGGNVNSTDHPPDTNIKEGITYAQYRSGSSQYTQSSGISTAKAFRRVIIIPIIEKDEFDHGRDRNVKIHDIAPFFLRNKVENGNGGDIEAEYIGTGFPVGNIYYDPNISYNGTGKIKVIGTPVLYK